MTPTLRILYAEDNTLDADLTRARFVECAPDLDLEVVGSGGACLDRLSDYTPDLVLLDHHLPDMEGLDVLRALVRAGAPPPVVLVTGVGDEELVVKALRLGASSYVPKTDHYLETLPSLLRDVIQEHRRHQGQGLFAGTPRRILFVEHHAMDTDLTMRHFTEAAPSTEVDPVRSCADALARLGQPPAYDAAVIDLRMPDMSGLDFVREARSRGLALPPFIMITGQGDEAAAIGSLRLGAFDYVTKREGYLDQLVYAVDRAIAHDRLQRLNAQMHAELAERKCIEAALHAKSLFLNTLMDAVPVPVFHQDIDGRFTGYNHAFVELFGGSPGDRLGKTLFDVAPGEQAEATRARNEGLLRAPGVQVCETQVEDTLGRLRDVVLRKAAYTDADGRIAGRIGAIIDITEQKRADEELRRANSLLATQLEASADGILVVDERGTIVLQNQRFATLWELPPGVVESRSSEAALRAMTGLVEEPAAFLAKVRHLYEHRDESSADEIRLEDGRCFERHSAPMFGGDGTYYGRVWQFRDVTARRRLEEQFRQSQKMEAMGSLAGGVAHDFNNLLHVILGFTELAIDEVHDNNLVRDALLEVKKAGVGAALLVNQLLTFGRKQVLRPDWLDLGEVAADLEKMLRRVIGEDVDLVLAIEPDLGRAMADSGQMKQVLMNLVVNARDAMPGGGKITIEVRNVEMDEELAARAEAVKPGSYVRLAVTDTGCGMDEHVQLRIFEPFFTTKEQGRGTGLGLSTVYGIVEQSGGQIRVCSEPGRGTTFHVYLPREDSPPGTRATAEPRRRRPTGTETILVVDDFEAMCSVSRLGLESAGYTVLTAADGEEAMQVSARHAGDIHLLLTDLGLPRMNGRALAQELSKIRPAMKVLFMSGYADGASAPRCVLDTGACFIDKPFSLVALAQRIREILDGGSGAGAAVHEQAVEGRQPEGQ